MDEATWLVTDNVVAMLEFLQHGLTPFIGLSQGPLRCATARKLRLWACACCRHALRITGGGRPESLRLCDLSDEFADGVIPYSQLESYRPTHPDCSWPLRYDRNVHITVMNIINDALFLPGQAALLRCVAGNPFRPVTLPDAARDPAVVRLARAIYDARWWDQMPLLWDALEIAGVVTERREACGRCGGYGYLRDDWFAGDEGRTSCRACSAAGHVAVPDETGAALRRHCLEPLHARGCWVLDLILGKE